LGHDDWRRWLAETRQWFREHVTSAEVVVAAYADWQEVDAPPCDDLCAFARRHAPSVFLLDTCAKAAGPDGRRLTLLDFLPARRVILLARLCRAAGVR